MSDNESENKLYFDIETTGLSAASSHITVIGTAYADREGVHVKQFICRKPTDEKKILQEFASYITGFHTLVHFNGRSFDIPYITSKFRFYQIRSTFYDMHETDLYRIAKTFSSLTGLSQMKQKDVEAYFGIQRTDTLSGADCVKAYMDYICCGDKKALEKLLLHNKEDLEGMIRISKGLEGFSAAAAGNFSLTEISGGDEEALVFTDNVSDSDGAGTLRLTLKLDLPFHSPISVEYAPSERSKGIPFSFEADKEKAVFSLKAYSGELKYFFEDYKDYYYLPAEGRAVHKSIGQFVDPAFREKAKKETAFEPVRGVFYPQCGSVIKPEFKSRHDDPAGWFRLEDVKDPEDLKKLIAAAFHAAAH